MGSVLAFDFGATSIRAIKAGIVNGELEYQEVMRASHKRVVIDGRSCWDMDLFKEKIVNTIVKYASELDSIAINTWGVDFVLADIDGNLLYPPISYRDDSHEIGFKKATDSLSLKEIFLKTGNQIMSINTLFQYLYTREFIKGKEHKLLMLPDYFNYLLCGQMCSERTIASTSQLYNLDTHEYAQDLLDIFNIDKNIFNPFVNASTMIGSTKNSCLEALREYDIKVVAVGSHDTASAVALTKAMQQDDYMFLSSGTWSLLGCITDHAIISDAVFDASLTNESGLFGKNLLFKNITGLYVFEKLKAALESKLARSIGFDEINAHVNASALDTYFDIEDSEFSKDEFEVIRSIDDKLGYSLEHDFDYFKVVYNSLLQVYVKTAQDVAKISGRTFSGIHIIGGGAQSDYLCQSIANKLGLDVIAGPIEASALGNILVQMLTLGIVQNSDDGMKLIFEKEKVKSFKPA